MKKILFSLLLTLLPIFAFSQISFSLGYVDNSRVIYSNGKLTWYVWGFPHTSTMSLYKSQVDTFHKFAIKVRNKYHEWKKISEENDLFDINLEKPMNITFPNITGNWTNDRKQYVSLKGVLKAIFVYLPNKSCGVRFETKINGNSLSFTLDEEELNQMCEVISTENLNEKLNEKQRRLVLY